MREKKILDMTCGMRGIWFDKHNPNAIYFDKRNEHYTSVYGSHPSERHIDIEPDVIGDFTNLPFADNTFDLVVFDPPHIVGGDQSWLKKMYSFYETKEEAMESVTKGFSEGMRVLKNGGTLVFKWAETSISTRELINSFGVEPLFGHRSGKKSGTHWMCFMKLEE